MYCPTCSRAGMNLETCAQDRQKSGSGISKLSVIWQVMGPVTWQETGVSWVW